MVRSPNGRSRAGHSPEALGPRPAWQQATCRPALSASRQALLGVLEGQPKPVSIAALIALTGLHANTLREHLDALVRAGLVRRERAAAAGRGRPAWLYSAAPAEPPAPEYAGLASALAASIQRSSSSPREDAIAAGRDWGRQLARETGDGADAGSARRRVVALLAGLGFAPEPDSRDAVVKLTRCPLLEAAHRHPDVVCGVHLGIVQGALEVYGGDLERTDLHAFSEPGACRLDLAVAHPRARA